MKRFLLLLSLFSRLALAGPTTVTLVIPAHNEAESLPKLVEEIRSVDLGPDYQLSILIVDDHSSDNTSQVLEQLQNSAPNLASLRTERQLGKAGALRVGFRAVQGDLVLMMDADLQNNPRDIPALLEALKDPKVDFVNGRRRFRNDTWMRRLESRAGNFARQLMLGSHTRDMGSGLKAFKRWLLPTFLSKETEGFEGMHRYMPELAAASGGKVKEVPIEDRPRLFGHAHYGFGRGLRLFGQIQTVRQIRCNLRGLATH